MVIGQYNVPNQSSTFIIGKGTENSRSNLFRAANSAVVSDPVIFASGPYATSGADYAEYFEWQTPQEFDNAIGRFVTLVGKKIRIAAQTDDYILGVISSTPGVIGNIPNCDDYWHGKYETDRWGRIVYDEQGEPKINQSYRENEEF